MSTAVKPAFYSASMERCVGFFGGTLWFTAKSTGGDSSDSIQIELPTDPESVQIMRQWLATL